MHRSIRQIITEAIPLCLLLGFAVYYLGFLLREDVVVFGGSPGQFYRFWYPLEVSFPNIGSIIDWNPYWYAGYPELQFYPPGFVLLGLALKMVTWGQLSTVLDYQIVNFLAYVLPGLTIYLFLRLSGFGRLAGTASGFFALVFPDLLGGAGAIFDGMLGDRLSLGLFPLVLLAGSKASESRRKTPWLIVTAFLLAAIVLLHSFQAVAPVLALVFYSLFRQTLQGEKRLSLGFLFKSILVPALASVLAIVLTAFWLLPLLANSRYATPVLRTPLSDLDWWLFAGRLPFFLVFACLAVMFAFSFGQRQKQIVFTLAATPLAILTFMFFDYLVMIDRLGIYSLDPIRFVETIYFCVLILAGVGFAFLVRFPWNIARASRLNKEDSTQSQVTVINNSARFASFCCAGVLLYLSWQPFPAWIDSFRPERPGEPRLVSTAVERYHLDKLWTALKQEPAGRILFTSSQFRLRRSGAEVLPTYLMALTPLKTGREIIGGTFHHWSPLATFYWYGFQKPAVMRERTDLMDDQSLFGMKWQSMDGEVLYAIIKRLNITSVVASDYDLWARTFLDRSPHFKAVLNDPEYVVYQVQDYTPSLIEADNDQFVGTVTEYTGQRLTVHVQQTSLATALSVKIAEYPLWRAVANGKEIGVKKDEMGLMKLDLPPGADYDVVLSYEKGPLENGGLVVTALILAVSIMTLLYTAVRKVS